MHTIDQSHVKHAQTFLRDFRWKHIYMGISRYPIQGSRGDRALMPCQSKCPVVNQNLSPAHDIGLSTVSRAHWKSKVALAEQGWENQSSSAQTLYTSTQSNMHSRREREEEGRRWHWFSNMDRRPPKNICRGAATRLRCRTKLQCRVLCNDISPISLLD